MLSIIIPTYNEADHIAQTISKTHDAKGRYDIEIIVVDGGSTDETMAVAKECGAITVVGSMMIVYGVFSTVKKIKGKANNA